MITSILAHENHIYRTQRAADESRQILPGYSIRRIPIAPDWAGKTIVELAIRQRFQLGCESGGGELVADNRNRPSVCVGLVWFCSSVIVSF